MRSRLPRIWAIFAILQFFAILPLKADGFWDRFSWSLAGSVLFFPEDNGNEGDPMPVLPSFGGAAAFRIWGPVSIELTEDLYFTNYRYSQKLDRAVPAAIENRSAFVFGFFTGLQALVHFPLNDIVSFRAYGGPAADFRAITLAADLHPDDFTGNPESDAGMQTDSVREYFWDRGRWFMPVLGGGADFSLNEKFLLGIDARIWFPVYRLWTDEDLPGIEGWRFGIGLRVTPRG
ncbi:MAG: hypothetical protein LBJ90_01605 [Treponema sp.]|jgi:hypothetical protein|nr:hypothetical protein [Treponema sp.]